VAPSDDPIASTAKGVTQGIIEHAEDKIKEFVKKLRQGELAFIEDEETIERVTSQKQKPGWKIYQNYIKDKQLRVQVQMGFCLKDLETTNSIEKLKKLRGIIYKKYGPNGLNVAELTQRGLLERYVLLLLGKNDDDASLRAGIEEILRDVSRYVFFIKAEEDIVKTGGIIVARINGSAPRAILLLSRGKDAEKKADEIVGNIQINTNGYSLEIQKELDTCQNHYFLLRKDIQFDTF